MSQTTGAESAVGAADAEDLLTYEQAAAVLGVGYFQLTDFVARGALDAHRPRGSKRKYLSRAQVDIYAEIRKMTRTELERRVLSTLTPGSGHSPTPGRPRGNGIHRGAVDLAALQEQSAEPSLQTLHAAWVRRLDQADAESLALQQRKGMRRRPGEKPTWKERGATFVSVMLELGQSGFVRYVSGAVPGAYDLDRFAAWWTTMLQIAELDPSARADVEAIRERVLNPPEAAAPVDPRQMPLPEAVNAGQTRVA